jgi:hypothetical protein
MGRFERLVLGMACRWASDPSNRKVTVWIAVAVFYSPVFNMGCSLVALGEFGRN